MSSPDRRAVIAARLTDVRARIAAAAAAAERSPEQITLVVVTKTWPATDIRVLVELGVHDIGENRHQEARDKVAELADTPRLRWHFVGQIQSNKASGVAEYADVVHSLDSARTIRRLGRTAARLGRTICGLVQVSLDPQPGSRGTLGRRGGAAAEQADRLAELVAETDGLELGGVMGLAPVGESPRPAYDKLAEIGARIRAGHPSATAISAGMSADFEDAILAGATHVRVGSAVLGQRRTLR